MSLDESKKVTAIRTFAQDAARMQGMSKKDIEKEPLRMPEEAPARIPEKAPLQTEPKAKKLKKSVIKKSDPVVPEKQTLIAPAEITAEVNKMAPENAPSILAEETGIDVSSGSVSGTIIRDTKRKRFRLFPAMVQATTEWFVGKKTAYETSKRPQQVIENADARKEIINAAVQKETLAPKEDFRTVAEKLKEAKRIPLTSTITLKDKADMPKPQWSYIEEEAEQTPAPLADIPKTEEEPMAVPQSMPEAITPPFEDAGEKSLPAAEIEEARGTKQQPPVEVLIPESEEVSIATELPLPQREEPPMVEEAQYVSTDASAHERRFPTYALIGVVLAATVLGVGASYYFFRETDVPQEKAIVYTIPSLIQATEQHPLLLQQSREELLGELRESINSTSGVVQFYPAQQQNDTQKPASAEEILLVLAPRTSAAFTRSITEIAFGGVNAEPYVVMKVTNFDTAFAGMLNWEKTMSADLTPLFGQTVVESFDPSARTDTQVREAFFKDVIASNKNARVLLDEEGRERIIYTFLDQNTILMTTTKDALQILVPLAR